MKQFLLLVLIVFAAGTYSHAQAFIYRPNNPNFGGNTFNYSWLLSQAQAQDRNVDPTTKRNTTTRTTTNSSLDSFSQSIQSQILSRITRNLVNDKFGEGDLKEGTYNFGDYQVDIRNGADGVVVRIVDNKGGETTVTVPYF
jgi:curli production assembly/transport component CsgF